MIKVCLFFLMILLMPFFILGCSSKNEKALMKIYEERKIKSMKLQKTEKIQLYSQEEGISKVLLTATYISKVKIRKKEKKDEVFIIGLYVDDNETQETEIKEADIKSFSLALNGKSPKSIKALKENSKYLEHIPFVLPWTKFYLVHFPYTANKSIQLTINHVLYGKGKADFAKVAKYVLHKKAF